MMTLNPPRHLFAPPSPVNIPTMTWHHTEFPTTPNPPCKPLHQTIHLLLGQANFPRLHRPINDHLFELYHLQESDQ